MAPKYQNPTPSTRQMIFKNYGMIWGAALRSIGRGAYHTARASTPETLVFPEKI